jgi:hypothetical protein
MEEMLDGPGRASYTLYMMKHFTIVYNSEHAVEFTKAQCFAARNAVNYDGAEFFIKGVKVSAERFYDEVEAECDAKIAKKSETHKKITVNYGSSTSKVRVWVKK